LKITFAHLQQSNISKKRNEMMAQWEGVCEFVAVAKTSSFTAAAKKMRISVAKVSRCVAALEERLGVKLLHRTTRKVSLTEAGQLYFEHCSDLVNGLEQAELSVTRMQSSPQGLVKLTAPTTYGEKHLAPLLIKFLKHYPQVDVDLMLTNKKLDLIDTGIDLAIRLGKLDDSNLTVRRLAGRHLYVCASPSYLEHHGTPYTLSELNQHQCLVGTLDHWRFKDNGRSRSMHVSGRFKCNNGNILRNAAKRGFGLVQLPDYYVTQDLKEGILTEVLSTYRSDPEGIWALYPKNRNLSPKIRLLIDFLAHHLKP
jgi:DNA-binding transcriptional LysR family regulator